MRSAWKPSGSRKADDATILWLGEAEAPSWTSVPQSLGREAHRLPGGWGLLGATAGDEDFVVLVPPSDPGEHPAAERRERLKEALSQATGAEREKRCLLLLPECDGTGATAYAELWKAFPPHLVFLLVEGAALLEAGALRGFAVTSEQTARVARDVAASLGLRGSVPTLVACPTCGRCRIDVRSMYERIAARLMDLEADVSVAVMGCEVNGPGEAVEADFGVAGTSRGTEVVLFRKGKVVCRCPQEEAVEKLMGWIRDHLLSEAEGGGR